MHYLEILCVYFLNAALNLNSVNSIIKSVMRLSIHILQFEQGIKLHIKLNKNSTLHIRKERDHPVNIFRRLLPWHVDLTLLNVEQRSAYNGNTIVTHVF